jgi:hypothetical protein
MLLFVNSERLMWYPLMRLERLEYEVRGYQ